MKNEADGKERKHVGQIGKREQSIQGLRNKDNTSCSQFSNGQEHKADTEGEG